MTTTKTDSGAQRHNRRLAAMFLTGATILAALVIGFLMDDQFDEPAPSEPTEPVITLYEGEVDS